MTYTPQDARLSAHNETQWDMLNNFFAHFTTQDWMRPHGREWTFGDVPYHMMYFQSLAVESIRKGQTDTEHQEIRTMRELNQFNQSRFAARPSNQTGEQSFALFRRSQETLRTTLRSLGGDQPDFDHLVWYGVLRARGWHTTRFMMEYTYWHNWLHFSEATLRYNNQLPPISAEMMHHALTLHMDFTAGALNHRVAADRFVWVLTLTGSGGGTWTITVDKGEGHAHEGEPDSGTPDLYMTRPIDVHLKAAFNMMNPLRVSMFTRITGAARKRALLAKLFTPAPDEVWTPIDESEVEPMQG